jgi:hypothetical protein
MRIAGILLLSVLCASLNAQSDSLRKKSRIHFGITTSASYQIAVNGKKAETNLGDFAFKGYMQPSIGLAMMYEQDSTEYAMVAVSASRLSYTLGSQNILNDSGNTYDIFNRFDVFMNNYSLSASYNRRLAQMNPYNSLYLEAGMALHYIQEYNTLRVDDSIVGPYTVATSLETVKKNYFLPSAYLGLNAQLRTAESKTRFIVGLGSSIFLDNLSEVKYSASYSQPSETISYSFRWAPVLMMTRISVAVVF